MLTGTPVQNNLKETFSLLHYLFPHVFDEESASIFEKCFSLNSFASKKINIDRTVLNNAHYMLRPFILRRIKTEVEQTLPPKLETMIYCPLSDMQRFWTKMLLLRDGSMLQKQFQDGGKSSDSSSNSGVLSRLHGLLAQLRKAANHPYLFPGAEKISDADEVASEDIISASGKLEILDRLLAKLEAKGHRVVLFSQFTQVLDILSDYLDYRGYNHCRLDGSTNRVMREVRMGKIALSVLYL